MPDSGFGGIARRFDLDKPLIPAVKRNCHGRRLRDCARLRHHHRCGNGGICAAGTACWPCRPCRRTPTAAREIGVKAGARHDPHRTAVSARDGLRSALSMRWFPAGEALQAARRWAAQILETQPDVGARLPSRPVYRGLAEASGSRCPRQSARISRKSPRCPQRGFAEGPAAFAEKRPPAGRDVSVLLLTLCIQKKIVMARACRPSAETCTRCRVARTFFLDALTGPPLPTGWPACGTMTIYWCEALESDNQEAFA